MQKKHIINLILIIVISTLGLTLFNKINSGGDFAISEVETNKVLTLEFNDFDGNIVRLSDFAGTPLVINTWATWCPFCKKELPDFSTAQDEFGNQVAIIAIDRAESLEVAKNYTDSLDDSLNVILLLDQNDEFYKTIGGFSMPETIFIDKNGIIQEHKRGPMELTEIRHKIQALISS